MPGTPARSGAVMLAGSGVLAIVMSAAGVCLAVTCTATPAQAATVPVTVTPDIAMPGLPVTFTIACGPSVKSAVLYGKTINLNGPVAMKSTRGGTFAVTVNLPTGMPAGVYQVLAGFVERRLRDCGPDGERAARTKPDADAATAEAEAETAAAAVAAAAAHRGADHR